LANRYPTPDPRPGCSCFHTQEFLAGLVLAEYNTP
jgi:hypothetical protein